MPTSRTKKQVYINFDLEDWTCFQRLYPNLIKEYCKRCVRLAVYNPDLFNQIFFNTQGVKQ